MHICKKTIKSPNALFVIGILSISVILIFFRPHFQPVSYSDADTKTIEGKVIKILSEREISKDDIAYIGATKIQKLSVEIKENGKIRQIEAENEFSTFKKGDRVFVQAAGNNSFEVVEVSRTRGILWLSLLFIALVLLTSGKKGFNSLVGLVYSFAVILFFIVPRILKGSDPVIISLIGAVLILVVTLYVSYGFNKKSLSAFIGISLTLLFVGLLARYAVYALHFTGFGNEEASFLQQEMGEKINFISLVVGGIIIAAIGVLDDIAITQASTVFTIASVNASIKRWDLYKKAMSIGKDHISAVINTLIMAYTGAALPLVLLLSIGKETNTGNIISMEMIAEEIVRTLVSSSGLVLAVPITTFIAVIFAQQAKDR